MHPTTVTGVVTQGLGEGAQLGYPTANLSYTLKDDQSLLPGIYAGKVFFEDGGQQQEYHGAVVIGGDHKESTQPKFEVYVISYHGDLYGKELRVHVLDKVRDMQRFESTEKLIAQIEDDLRKIAMIFESRID